MPINEDFIVVNDKTGDTDKMRYPGDAGASMSNVANCMCNIGFDKDIPPSMLRKYERENEKEEEINKSYKNLEEIVKEEIN